MILPDNIMIFSSMYAGTICPQIENGKKGDERYFFKLSQNMEQLNFKQYASI